MSHARVALFELITQDVILNALGVDADSVWNTNAVNSPEVRPFVVIRWQATEPRIGNTGPQTVTFWVYDKPADYSIIDSIIRRIDTLLLDVAHYVGSDGSSLTSAKPQGISEDLYDDIFGAIVKNTSWLVLSRQSG